MAFTLIYGTSLDDRKPYMEGEKSVKYMWFDDEIHDFLYSKRRELPFDSTSFFDIIPVESDVILDDEEISKIIEYFQNVKTSGVLKEAPGPEYAEEQINEALSFLVEAKESNCGVISVGE